MKRKLIEIIGTIVDIAIVGVVLGLILAIACVVAGYIVLGFARIAS